jgi:hypothetical protein
MFFWLREIAGWLLVCVSLYLLRMGLIWLSDVENPRIVEAGVIVFAALGVMRAGILLVRVSTASRMSQLKPSDPDASPR